MIEKLAKDVSNKLNTTIISRDFEDIVGIEAHLEKMQSLLHLDYEDGAMIVGIFGPAGIGKTTIARALHSRLSSNFQLTCFMENVSGSYNKSLDDHGKKLSLQKQLLSKILNQNDMKIDRLGVIRERLHHQKVLIILDDVDDLEQLEAVANETSWFGPGSRIIVTTKNQEILEQHDINDTYHVDFPRKDEARKIICRYAFGRSLAPDGFEKLVERATELCSNLPLGLSVIGSTLRRKSEDDWEGILRRLENSLDRKIGGVLRVGYENLHKDDQSLFLLIACFFNYQDEEHVKAMVGDCILDVRLGLKTLAYRSLIQKSTEGVIVMHKLLQQVGREAVQRQDQGKRQILIENNEICDVLENDSGNGSVMGISFDISTLKDDVNISARAFKRMYNLRFLSMYKTSFDTKNRVHVPDDMNFPSRLRLLDWEEYPGKSLPPTFTLEYLVELNLQRNKLEKLWGGIQPLTNLKKMSLEDSDNLKELPDLSNATNLEKLNLDWCDSLVEIPSSFGKLQKLKRLQMPYCRSLKVVSTHLNLASLEFVNMLGCGLLRKVPDIFRNITSLTTTDLMFQDLPESIRLWSRLEILCIFGSRMPYRIVEDIKEIPDCIKDLHGLKELFIHDCHKLASLPELPASLTRLRVYDCESLEILMPFRFTSPIHDLHFTNCHKLGDEARRVIQKSMEAWLPGKNVPEEFEHRVIGNSLTIPSGANQFRYCIVVSPKQQMKEYANFMCRLSCNGSDSLLSLPLCIPKIQTEHLYMSSHKIGQKLGGDVVMEFSTSCKDLDIIECGFQSFTDLFTVIIDGSIINGVVAC